MSSSLLGTVHGVADGLWELRVVVVGHLEDAHRVRNHLLQLTVRLLSLGLLREGLQLAKGHKHPRELLLELHAPAVEPCHKLGGLVDRAARLEALLAQLDELVLHCVHAHGDARDGGARLRGDQDEAVEREENGGEHVDERGVCVRWTVVLSPRRERPLKPR
eukprot:CAMPEP_0185188910 /NCGR_PEP_ID=MMETSP1140-20130426/5697_1 /TAXON_ID=298111 /ORGANISM="Pavlova sp., Strain CCMP459" /LENGTH=161 /DNA_ID=CAMNT_0027755427 /DNA_START=648 /DNA_END=1130 /DNA_ORIENTATION=+